MLHREQSTAVAGLLLKNLSGMSSFLKPEQFFATKDGCAALLAASGSQGCGVYRVDAAVLAFSTVRQKLQTAARSAANGVSKVQKWGVEVHGLAHPVEVLASHLGK